MIWNLWIVYNYVKIFYKVDLYKDTQYVTYSTLLVLCSLTTRWHEPLCSAAPCERLRELFQHPLVSRCCCQHALTACYPPHTSSQYTPHTHTHTWRQWEGCGPREPWLPHNYYPPSLKLLPLWKRERERGRGEGQRTRVRPLACFTLCVWVYVFIWLVSRCISGLC